MCQRLSGSYIMRLCNQKEYFMHAHSYQHAHTQLLHHWSASSLAAGVQYENVHTGVGSPHAPCSSLYSRRLAQSPVQIHRQKLPELLG